MKKMILTVIMLFSAVGVSAQASNPGGWGTPPYEIIARADPATKGPFDVIVTLHEKEGSPTLEYVGINLKSGWHFYWQGDAIGQPLEIWLKGSQFTSDDKNIANQLEQCENKKRRINFSDDPKNPAGIFPTQGAPYVAYKTSCLLEVSKKNPMSIYVIDSTTNKVQKDAKSIMNALKLVESIPWRQAQ